VNFNKWRWLASLLKIHFNGYFSSFELTGMNLLHYVALQAERTHPELLTLPDDLAILEEASRFVEQFLIKFFWRAQYFQIYFSRTPLEQLRSDFNKLDGQINKIKVQLGSPSTHPTVKKQMEDFLPVSWKGIFLLSKVCMIKKAN